MNKWWRWWYVLTHWEYWSIWSIYLPLIPAWLYLAIRDRSLFFYSHVNPSMAYGGMSMASKYKIYELIPEAYIPKTQLFQAGSSLESIENRLLTTDMDYPLVIKPDIGIKGLGVHILHDREELKSRLLETTYDFIIQEKIPYTHEVGIFYHRYPNDAQGKCTGMVKKEYLSVTGDGSSTMRELVMKYPRARLQINAIEKHHPESMESIIPNDIKTILIPIGSHTRGSKFLDVSASLTPELVAAIDSVCRQIHGFHYGRLDIMYDNWDDLLLGKNFSIIEVNGAQSEPTHMYDPKHSIFFAWKEVVRHWTIMQTINAQNKKLNHTTKNTLSHIRALRENRSRERQLREHSL